MAGHTDPGGRLQKILNAQGHIQRLGRRGQAGRDHDHQQQSDNDIQRLHHGTGVDADLSYCNQYLAGTDHKAVHNEQEHHHEQHRLHGLPDEGEGQFRQQNHACHCRKQHGIPVPPGRNKDRDQHRQHRYNLRPGIQTVHRRIQRYVFAQYKATHAFSPAVLRIWPVRRTYGSPSEYQSRLPAAHHTYV